ncbi:PhoX family protein [Methyloversatilis sp. XJ19-13]|uniref:PhoX family protein n=1 Tax=Methyloversatilis sp. XJ19-13 TaxID=2963430 RepID=UPI00211CFFDA|nr:PhoX family protein [Methyloversatilis sp. XJ19-13]MCQ9374708.1 PhoX family protein [Methyloversatilis sp. XJ19-13]
MNDNSSKTPVNTTRRNILKGSASLAAAPFVTTFGMMAARNAEAQTCTRLATMVASPYGIVAPVADQTTGLPLLMLPPGFSYKSMGWRDDVMTDGRLSPNAHDGMAVVRSRRVGRSTELTLIRNHELGTSSAPRLVNAPTYDKDGTGNKPAGGTTTLIVRDGNLVEIRPSLGGTMTNCAGGVTPWETWLTCEENTTDRTSVGGKKHGYVFEVCADPDDTTARPIVDMGRFRHEAVAVDPTTNHAYETEDASPVSALYRFVPDNDAGGENTYADGGKLYAARIKQIVRSSYAMVEEVNQTGFTSPCVGDEYVLEWVEIADPDAAPTSVNVLGQNRNVSGPFAQAWAAGCARMLRGEGIWYHAGKIYIVDTSAGGEGCVWELTLATQHVKAIYVSSNQRAGNNLDNITVSPRGGLLCCEDGGTSSDELGNGLRLFGLGNDGQPYMFAKSNVSFTAAQYAAAGKTLLGGTGNQLGSEFAGACFDPTGRILFVNNYTPGITFAITGPWAKGNL